MSFFGAKIVVSVFVFFGLWLWSYADLLDYEAYIKNDFVIDESARDTERNCFWLFLMMMLIYAVLAARYSYKALTVTQGTNPSRFRNKAGGLVLIVSSCTVSLVVFPFSSQTL